MHQERGKDQIALIEAIISLLSSKALEKVPQEKIRELSSALDTVASSKLLTFLPKGCQ